MCNEPGAAWRRQVSRAWLGIDLGTQSVRALAVNEAGRVAGQGSHPIRDKRENDRHEQDPEDWWTATIAAVRQALEEARGVQVNGIAVDGTSGTILLSDADGRARTPGLMYDDARADEHMAQTVNEAGAEVWRALGYRMQPSWALPKLAWLAREEPELLAGARLLTQADYINWRLAGTRVASDASNSLKCGYDSVREHWPGEVFERLGITADILPEVVRPGSTIGAIGSETAKVMKLAKGTAIIAGMTDGCAAQIGSGAVSEGSWNSVLGTTLVLKGVTAELVHDPNGVVYSHRSADGNWLPGGASSTGAGILTKAFSGRNLAELDREASAHEPASVVTYPLAGRGERFPFTASQAEGFTLGEPRNEADYFASLLQGVAFLERLSFHYLSSIGAATGGDLSFSGGGTKSPYWTQLRADVLGRSVRLPENAEPAFGMAVLAASQGRSITETARAMVHIRETIDPRPGHTDRFLESYERFVHELVRRGWMLR